jgi:hypothetical protein
MLYLSSILLSIIQGLIVLLAALLAVAFVTAVKRRFGPAVYGPLQAFADA